MRLRNLWITSLIATLLWAAFATSAVAVGHADAPLEVVVMILLMSLAVYFAPCFIALFRDHEQKGPIIIICLFTGWTGIGWLVALAWSFSSQRRRR